MSPMEFDCDVGIVGAGPAGLSLAIGLSATAPQLRVKVFERSPELTPSGAAVTLFANGLNALEAISADSLEAVRAVGTGGLGMVAHDTKTDEAVSIQPSSEWKLAPDAPPLRPPIFIPWFKLQCALRDSWKGSKEGGLVLGKALDSVQQGKGQEGATLHFKDGSSARARVVIGADGNMSAMRSALFDGELPEYIGTAFWRALVRPVPSNWDMSVEHQKPGWLHNWVDSKTGKLMMMRVFDDHLSISAASSWPKERLQELWRRSYYGGGSDEQQKQPHETKRKRFLEVFGSDFPEFPTSLLTSIDPAVMVEHGTFYRDPSRPWGRGCCTLLGDAAHTMPPNFGQGTSMAFEGSYHLAVHLGRGAARAFSRAPGGTKEQEAALQQELVAALRSFESQHIERVRPISEAANAVAKQFYQDKDGKTNPLASSKQHDSVLKHIFSDHQGHSPFAPLSLVSSSAGTASDGPPPTQGSCAPKATSSTPAAAAPQPPLSSAAASSPPHTLGAPSSSHSGWVRGSPHPLRPTRASSSSSSRRVPRGLPEAPRPLQSARMSRDSSRCSPCAHLHPSQTRAALPAAGVGSVGVSRRESAGLRAGHMLCRGGVSMRHGQGIAQQLRLRCI